MAHTISLKYFNSDFSSSSSIDVALLKKNVAQRNNLKLEEEDDRITLSIIKDNSEWWPLLWISTDYAYINSDPIFELGLYYDLVDIAESINACIITEDGILLFIPKYGLLYDPEENEDFELELEELNTEISTTENLALAIKNIIARKQRSRLKGKDEIRKKQNNIENQHEMIAKFESKQHYIAIAVFVVLICLFILKKIRQ